jgi:D-glycero-alpha-D-manno-heptose-7-phosphate kinase
MRIRAVAPTRIDLAGGTLDIYPLYLFEEGGLTVNIGIDLRSEVVVETRDDGRAVLQSIDTGAEAEAPSVAALEMAGPLGFVARIVRYYAPECGVTVRTRNTVPKGSGLGASSSLLIALTGALCKLRNTPLDDHRMVDLAANLEAQCIGVPTGKQDYWPAVRGGINALWFNVDGTEVERLVVREDVLRAIEENLILSFTIEHNSSVTNWSMFRNYIDGAGETRRHMRQIKATAVAMRQALTEFELEQFGAVLRSEWDNRKRLADDVTTPEVERMIAAAENAGAMAHKLCGAGGGGCMITLARPGTRAAVEAALTGEGASLLRFGIARDGLHVAEEE